MQGIEGLGAAGSGNVLPNLKSGANANSASAFTPNSPASDEIQSERIATSSSQISIASKSSQFSDFLTSAALNPEHSQMMQALVALMILIALLEQVQNGEQSGNNLLQALSSGLGSGGSASGTDFASSYVAYEQTTVVSTTSSGDAGAAGGQGGERSGGQAQLDVTA